MGGEFILGPRRGESGDDNDIAVDMEMHRFISIPLPITSLQRSSTIHIGPIHSFTNLHPITVNSDFFRYSYYVIHLFTSHSSSSPMRWPNFILYSLSNLMKLYNHYRKQDVLSFGLDSMAFG